MYEVMSDTGRKEERKGTDVVGTHVKLHTKMLITISCTNLLQFKRESIDLQYQVLQWVFGHLLQKKIQFLLSR